MWILLIDLNKQFKWLLVWSNYNTLWICQLYLLGCTLSTLYAFSYVICWCFWPHYFSSAVNFCRIPSLSIWNTLIYLSWCHLFWEETGLVTRHFTLFRKAAVGCSTYCNSNKYLLGLSNCGNYLEQFPHSFLVLTQCLCSFSFILFTHLLFCIFQTSHISLNPLPPVRMEEDKKVSFIIPPYIPCVW